MPRVDRSQWRSQVIEKAIEPEIPIIDSHHHVWSHEPFAHFEPYDADLAIADKANSGHQIVSTVYVDSRSGYHSSGPAALRVVGETEFADRVAEHGIRQGGRAAGVCAGIVSHADLLLGARVGDVLDAHMAASRRFRGIRFMTAFEPGLPPVFGGNASEEMMQPAFREGFAELVRRGLSFDAWVLQPQVPELIDLARQFPEANIVVDHLGGPLALGRYANRSREGFADWKRIMTGLAELPNVAVKLGGLNMHSTGLDAINQPRPNTSQETEQLHREHILTAIDLFGPARCMFESNFPVDMLGISYVVLWNSFKRITAGFTDEERNLLFSGTAARVYHLGRPDDLPSLPAYEDAAAAPRTRPPNVKPA